MQYVNKDGVIVQKNPNKVILIGAAAAVAVAVGFGAVALAGNNDGGQGGNGPVVTEAPVPAPTDGGSNGSGTGDNGDTAGGATDLGGLTYAEETAILDYEYAYGIDLGAVDERTLLDNAYLAVDEYALYGYSFDDIYNEGVAATGDPAWVLDAMTVAFDYLAPEFSADYTAWYYA